MPESFKKNIFINCPFDDQYLSLLRPLLFSVLYLGFNPRLALERTDSSETSISKIIELIQSSKYGIHDLSRCKASKKGEYFRLNMPFELGLDVGCKLFKNDQWATKKCLILETEKYRYQAAISDLSNSVILSHKDEPEEVVFNVRNWLVQEALEGEGPGPSQIWGKFIEFMARNYDQLKSKGFSDRDIERLPIPELMGHMKNFLNMKN